MKTILLMASLLVVPLTMTLSKRVLDRGELPGAGAQSAKQGGAGFDASLERRSEWPI
jgi:hypothetical protein